MSLISNIEYKNKILSVVGVVQNGDIQDVYFKSYLVEIKVIILFIYHPVSLHPNFLCLYPISNS